MLGEAAERWVEWVNTGRKYAESDTYTEVRYETLIGDGPRELARVYDFLGFPLPADQVEKQLVAARGETQPLDELVELRLVALAAVHAADVLQVLAHAEVVVQHGGVRQVRDARAPGQRRGFEAEHLDRSRQPDCR